MTEPGEQAASGRAGELASALDAVAATLEPMPRREVREGSIAWLVEGQPIVILAGGSASFRLGPEIGAAARRTPDVTESILGQEWVAFSPGTLDGHALDRLGAWFAAAHRRVEVP